MLGIMPRMRFIKGMVLLVGCAFTCCTFHGETALYLKLFHGSPVPARPEVVGEAAGDFGFQLVLPLTEDTPSD